MCFGSIGQEYKVQHKPMISNFKSELDKDNSILNISYDLNRKLAKEMAEHCDAEIMTQLNAKQLMMSSKVRALVEALEYIVKRQGPINVGVAMAETALAEWSAKDE
jgi:Glu-tRNA(Gln) amidotransferase subunit E-like FAD-binding protein